MNNKLTFSNLASKQIKVSRFLEVLSFRFATIIDSVIKRRGYRRQDKNIETYKGGTRLVVHGRINF